MGRALKAVTPIARTTLTAAAFEQLISYVVKGSWKAGDRIPPERQLCQQLGIARTSLREALKAMELIGMLDSRVGDGTFVCPRTEFLSRPLLWAFTGNDHAELHDIMEARTIIEENLAGLAAERGSDDEIGKIGEAVQAMRDSIARGDSILEADMAFHIAICEAARNEVLRNAVQLLRNLLRQWIYYKLLIPDIAPTVLKRHAAIYRAIAQRKPTSARNEMRRHLEETMRLVTQVVEQQHARSGQRVMNGRGRQSPAPVARRAVVRMTS
jgi:GntR family transcriptional regulator, transcriptional repressor for pyruvate dehydrogenase complex